MFSIILVKISCDFTVFISRIGHTKLCINPKLYNIYIVLLVTLVMKTIHSFTESS